MAADESPVLALFLLPRPRMRQANRLAIRLAAGLCLALPEAAAAQQEYTVRHHAGGYPIEERDGSLADARFERLYAIEADPAGNVYVATRAQLHVISFAGEVGTLAGDTLGMLDGVGSSARFTAPSALRFDPASGDLLVGEHCALRRVTPGGRTTTIAGSTIHCGFVDGPAREARFQRVGGIAVGAAGEIYFSDAHAHTIRRLAGGVVTTLAGSAFEAGTADGPGPAARFRFPRGLELDGRGNLWVADTGNHTIRVVSPLGVVTTVAGVPGRAGHANGLAPAALFHGPSGLRIDAAGNVFVADAGNHRIRRIRPNGLVSDLAGRERGSANGSGSAASFDSPTVLALDPARGLFVLDYTNRLVRQVSLGGVVTTYASPVLAAASETPIDGPAAEARFHKPTDVAASPAGDVYVALAGQHTLRRIDALGNVTTLAGLAGSPGSADGPGALARFRSPEGVAHDPASATLVVADTGNHTIRRVTPQGQVSTLAGLAGVPGSQDGPGGAARFASPGDVAVDALGNVYVADTFNHTLRRVDPLGNVTTLAGQAGAAGWVDGVGASARFRAPARLALFGTTLHLREWGLGFLRVLDTQSAQVSTLRTTPAVAPISLAVEPSGSLLLNDRYTLWRVDATGGATAVAGGWWGYADRTGLRAAWRDAGGMDVSPSGELFFPDPETGVIRRALPAPPDTARLDCPLGAPGSLRRLAADPPTGGPYRWTFLRRPASSRAALAAPGAPVTGYTPDVADVVRFRLEAGRERISDVALNDFVIGGSGASTARCLGQRVYLSAGSSTDPSLSYQWYQDGNAIPGASAAWLDIPAFRAADAGTYQVGISSPCASIAMPPFVLEAAQGPDDVGNTLRLVKEAGGVRARFEDVRSASIYVLIAVYDPKLVPSSSRAYDVVRGSLGYLLPDEPGSWSVRVRSRNGCGYSPL